MRAIVGAIDLPRSHRRIARRSLLAMVTKSPVNLLTFASVAFFASGAAQAAPKDIVVHRTIVPTQVTDVMTDGGRIVLVRTARARVFRPLFRMPETYRLKISKRSRDDSQIYTNALSKMACGTHWRSKKIPNGYASGELGTWRSATTNICARAEIFSGGQTIFESVELRAHPLELEIRIDDRAMTGDAAVRQTKGVCLCFTPFARFVFRFAMCPGLFSGTSRYLMPFRGNTLHRMSPSSLWRACRPSSLT